jgi:multiple sugar transport system substrate-binding protein
MRKSKILVASALAAVLLGTTAGCSPASDDNATEDKVIKVSYLMTDGFTQLDAVFQKAKVEYEDLYPGVTVQLDPITGTDSEYTNKLALMHQSADTQPDVFYQDSFLVRSDVAAGYLLNLDSYVANWEDWANFDAGAKTAGMDSDGSVYGISNGTDTRGIFYRKSVIEAAGLSLPWQPKSWDELLSDVRQIKESTGKIALNTYSGNGAGEGAVMQGFFMFLYGTGEDPLYDNATGKWVIDSQGFKDSLRMYETLFAEELAAPVSEAVDGNMWQKVLGPWIKDGTVAATIDGSWVPRMWGAAGGDFEWPEYVDEIGVAYMPNQAGNGAVTLSGGWTLAVGDKTKHPQEAFNFLALALNYENSLKFYVENAQVSVRTDVAQDPAYQAGNIFVPFFTDLVSSTHFRPATSDYPKISLAVQQATDDIMNGKKTVDEASADYDKAVIAIVGEENTIKR